MQIHEQASATSVTTAAAPAAGSKLAGHSTTAFTKGQSARPSSATSMNQKKLIKNLRFECGKNAHYYEDRARFFDIASKTVKCTSIFSISSLAVAWLSNVPQAFVTVLGTIFLALTIFNHVVDFGSKQRHHEALRKSFRELLVKLSEPNTDLGEIQRQIQELFVSEPPEYQFALACAYNKMVDEHGDDPAKKLALKWLQILFRHVIPAKNAALKTVREIADRSNASVSLPI